MSNNLKETLYEINLLASKKAAKQAAIQDLNFELDLITEKEQSLYCSLSKYSVFLAMSDNLSIIRSIQAKLQKKSQLNKDEQKYIDWIVCGFFTEAGVATFKPQLTEVVTSYGACLCFEFGFKLIDDTSIYIRIPTYQRHGANTLLDGYNCQYAAFYYNQPYSTELCCDSSFYWEDVQRGISAFLKKPVEERRMKQ